MRQIIAVSLVGIVQLVGCSNTDANSGVTLPTSTGQSAGTSATQPASTATAGTAAAVAAAGGAATRPTGAAGASTSIAVAGTSPASAGTSSPSAGAAAPVATAGTGTATAGSGGSAGDGAAGSTAGTSAAGGGGTPDGAYKPKCLSKGAELAFVGDSWINYPLGQLLAPRMAERAQKAGALAQGDSYNDQAVAGTSLASGGLGLIPDQWPLAKSAAERAGTSVKFVIMDGGGNDVLLGNQICLDNGAMRDQDPSCQKTVMDATLAGQMLETKMKMDGVGQAIFFFYPHVPQGGWDVLDYALPMAKATCESQNDEHYQCYFVDTRDAFQGPGNNGVAMAALIGPDGIHPSAAGDDVLADLLWKTMQDHCMAQSADSGCCTP